MAADYKRKTQSSDKSLSNLTSARTVHIDGSSSLVTIIPLGQGGRLLKVVNNAKGLSLNIRSGPRVLGALATTSVEGTYDYGVYVDNGLQVDVGGTGSATITFGD